MTSVQPEPVMANRSQPGETLRKAREGRSMALIDVAAALNLSPVALHNLESGAFDRLPGHTFARGYIRAYAKLLEMDQDLLVREFDQATGTNAAGSSVNSLGRIEEPARVSQGLLRMVSLAVLALLILAGFLWWQEDTSVREDVALLPGIEQVEVESAEGTTQIHPLEPEDQAVELIQDEEVVQLPESVGVDSVPATAEIVVAEPAPIVATVPAAEQPAIAGGMAVPAGAQAPTETVAVASAAEVIAPVATADQIVAAAGEGLLSIRFTANCWAQVTDADGKVLFSSLRRPGENITTAVKVPVEVRLGYASGAEVSFNGKVVDTQPFTTGETARLKLGL